MKRTRRTRRIVFTAAAVLLVAQASRAQSREADPASRPDILLILADDLGARDVSYRGGEIATPAIDRLAARGIRLERFYTCPVCSPTRAGLLTGRWPHRYGLMRAVIPPWSKYGLPAEEETLAESLVKAGYRHRGIIGKWHLGHARKAFHPLSRGFTYFYGHYNGWVDYFTHRREGEVDWHRNRETIHEEGYSTDLVGADAVRFIERASREPPYFLYVAFNAPHAPYQALPEDLARHENLKGRRRIYAAMVTALDRAVGRILDAVERSGRAEDTFIFFASDNGGVRGVADNRPWRGHKATVYEGGIRVPAIVSWPRGGLSGEGEYRGLAGYIDIVPTVRRIAGITAPPRHPLDGVDLYDALRGKADAPDRDWFTYLAMTERESAAVHTGPWKLVHLGPALPRKSEDGTKDIIRGGVLREPLKDPAVALYDLASDPGETRDVKAEHPKVTAALLDKLARFLAQQKPGVTAYTVGRRGFKAPEDWVIEAE